LKLLVTFLNFFFLALIIIVFTFLYKKTHDSAYLSYAEYTLNIFAIGIIIFLLPKIIEIISRLQNLKIRKKEVKKKNSISDIWYNYFFNLPVPAIVFDSDFAINQKNEAFLFLEEKIIKQNIIHLTDGLNLSEESLISSLKKSVLGKNKYEIIDVKLKSSGNQNYSLFITSPESDERENSFIAIFIDNSEKLELKEKFIQAQKMQGVGQLAGGIAHDFNNILTAIIGFCDLVLARYKASDQSFVDVMQIKQNANRAANLVRQLLAFSRRQTLQMEVLNITDVISEISSLLRRLIGENLKLNLDYSKEIWDIKADKAQLEQVLVNLAVNARDAFAGKNGEIKIKIENLEVFSLRDVKLNFADYAYNEDIEPGKYVRISFEDSGSGIKPENLKKIFEPFFTTKEVGKGTGLGLSTVSGIIQQSGGNILVSSEVGKGTQFVILLKRYERSLNDPKEVKNIKTDEKPQDLTGHGTILIVEDEDPVRLFSTRALKNKGYNVLDAFSGENALEIIEQTGGDKIDLIISDVVMPGISGPEMVEKVLAKHPNIKVVFVSGYGEDVFYQQYGMEREFNFLSKPYSLNQLAEKVKELLSR